VDLADDVTLGRLASWRIRMSRSRKILGSDCFFISKGILSSTNLIYTVTTMRSIPVDVLREILEHVDKNDLATLCRVNKICCA
jgi:F-box domain